MMCYYHHQPRIWHVLLLFSSSYVLPLFFFFFFFFFFFLKRTTHNTHITSIVRFTIVAFWYVILKGHWRIANHIKIKTRQNTRCVIVVLTRFVSYHFCDNFHEKKEKNIVILTKQE